MPKNKVDSIFETLTDAISEAKAKANSPWIVIGGDWNKYGTDSITRAFPDMQKHNTGPTRGPATLDYVFTNFENNIERLEVCFPLESASHRSDHGLVIFECLLQRPATFAWETHEYIKITKAGTEKFNNLIKAEKWESVTELAPQVDLMVARFQEILDLHMSECFVWKRIRRRSTDSPWLTDNLRAQIKKRTAIFRSEGRSERWRRICLLYTSPSPRD